MNKTFPFPLEVWPQTRHLFSIHWSDGVVQTFRLSQLQKACPCARCRGNEGMNHSQSVPMGADGDVEALFIRRVGRYGLRIGFTSGCSSGIYSFEQLRQFDFFSEGSKHV